MSCLEALLLGLLQGLTEFLPISSSGHLRVVPALVGRDDPGAAFTAVVQLGTMVAELLYFRSDLSRIAKAWLASVRLLQFPQDLDARLGWYLILATIPIGVAGLLFENQIEGQARDLVLIGSMLIVLALILLVADRVGRRNRGMGEVTPRDGIVMGLAQTLALVPGVSRSGATISAGLFLGLDRPTAARFSFLLSIPAVVLSGVYQAASLALGDEPATATPVALIAATVVAAVSGYAAIAFLLRFLVSHTTLVFVVYRLVLGSVVLGAVALGAVE